MSALLEKSLFLNCVRTKLQADEAQIVNNNIIVLTSDTVDGHQIYRVCFASPVLSMIINNVEYVGFAEMTSNLVNKLNLNAADPCVCSLLA